MNDINALYDAIKNASTIEFRSYEPAIIEDYDEDGREDWICIGCTYNEEHSYSFSKEWDGCFSERWINTLLSDLFTEGVHDWFVVNGHLIIRDNGFEAPVMF